MSLRYPYAKRKNHASRHEALPQKYQLATIDRTVGKDIQTIITYILMLQLHPQRTQGMLQI